jgi:hypothetical protein
MNRQTAICIIVSITILLSGSAVLTAGAAPEGRTYFIQVMGLEEQPYEAAADCLTFNATEACSLAGTCLEWERLESSQQSRKESAFTLIGEVDDEGMVITLDGKGRVNARGNKSSIAVASRASAMGVQLNFSFSGRQVGRARCVELVEEFYADASTP